MDTNLQLLSTEEMYARLKEVPNNQVYLFTISGENDQSLYYLGTHHTHDPNDTQFREIEELLDQFVEETKDKEKVVLVECSGLLPDYTDKEIAIKRSREVGFTTILARQKQVEVMSPEPTKIEEATQLLKNYSREDVFYFYMIHHCWNYSKMHLDVKPSHTKFINAQMVKYTLMEEFKDFDFSFEHFLEIYNAKHPTIPFDIENTNLFYEETKPANGNISESSGKIRDMIIIQKIYELWKQGKSIFIVYGKGHAVIQESALKELLR